MHLVISTKQIYSKRGRLFMRVLQCPTSLESATFVTSTTPLISVADVVNEEQERCGSPAHIDTQHQTIQLSRTPSP